jgi:hypothetical protein
MLWNIAVNDAGAEYDPLTLLRTRTMFGRPDWMTIYGQMRQAIESGQYIPGSTSQLKTKVGVSFSFSTSPLGLHSQVLKTYFCGAGAIAKALKEACVHHTCSTVEFTFAKVCTTHHMHISITLTPDPRNISKGPLGAPPVTIPYSIVTYYSDVDITVQVNELEVFRTYAVHIIQWVIIISIVL